MRNNKIDWLKIYFSKNNPLPDGIETMNYFEAGLIDSFGVIELIESIEEHYGIEFQQAHFIDRRFSTISGLADIICELDKQ